MTLSQMSSGDIALYIFHETNIDDQNYIYIEDRGIQ